ncbi:MAG: tandem-95 repeat protein, partial [Richelia sp. SM2_1_7]|nr:tandem-95 repeat protein [Richelia sp. SM2_1_7]
MFEWTPGFFQAGNFEIPFTVSDGNNIVTQTALITVFNANAAPVFDNLGQWYIQEGEQLRFNAFAFDADNPDFVLQERNADGVLTILEGSEATVNYTVGNLPPGATFDAETATFTWTPDFSTAGNYNVTFTATDDGDGTGLNATTTVSVPITVYNTNRAPSIIDFENISVEKGETTEFTITATDAESDNLRFNLIREREAGFGIPEFINFVDNLDGTALITVAPTNKDASGSYSFTLVVEEIRNDEETPLYTEKTFNITVGGTNDAPQIKYIGDKVAVIGEALKFDLIVGDNNQDNLTFDIQGNPTGATFIPKTQYGRATFEWTPTSSDIGSYPVTVKVTDSGNGNSDEIFSDEQTFNIVVRNNNTAPNLSPIPNLTLKEAETLELQLQATDTDGDTITYFATNFPENASLNPETGLLTWTPNYTQSGIYDSITIIATDGNKQSTQTFSIEVENTNRSPVIIPLPTQVGDENSFLRFKVNAVDYDVEGVIYSTSDLPSGASFDNRTGDFIWKPTFEQSGQYKFTFEAIDAFGAIGKRDVNILITDTNRNPELKVSNRGVALGETLSFTLDGLDPDNNTQLTYSADILPEGATLNAETGKFNWTPNPGQVDNYSINFSVSDGIVTTTENALIKVALLATNPTVNLDLTPSFPVIPNQSVTVTAFADSFAEIANITAKVNGEAVTIDKFGRFKFTPTTPGKVEIVAVATDADGRVGNASTVIKVRNPLDNDAPIVKLAPAINANIISNITNIVGQVSDVNLDNWLLEIAYLGETEFTEIASGEGIVDNNILTQIDPNKLNNGFYQLRLTATDISDRTSSTQTVIEVNSTNKTGYTRTETDLTYNFSSLPLNLTRTYNSLDNSWRLNTDTDIQTNVPLTGREELGVYEPYRVGTRLYLTTPTGERVGFTFAPLKQEISGLTYYTPEWVADAGINYTLSSVDAKLTRSGNRLYQLNTGVAYNPASGDFDGAEFTLTAVDGTKYLIDSKKGITEQIAANGISLVYSDSGITSSTGETVQFVNNEQGFLKQIIAPDGTKVIYDYLDRNLVAARNLSTGNVQRYGYNDSLLTLVTGNPVTNGSAISYGETPEVTSILSDLGGVVGWNGTTISGNLTSGIDRYTFGLRDGEIESTATGIVLVAVETQGITTINGLNPLVTSSGYGLYAIDKAGLNLLEVAGDGGYDLKLNIAGDVNSDGVVDGVDSAELSQVIASNADYNSIYDFNRDNVVNAADMQILGSNYGFASNRAPIVTASEVLTHTDLETFIQLDKLATDPEGDAIYFRVANPEQGTISFTPDGKSAVFTPNAGYSGDASFELIADDGYSIASSTIDINVSDAPLVNLDIVNRSPRLDVGESTQLVVIGDFSDQDDVILPASYLQFGSENELVGRITDTGVLSGLSDGVSIVSVGRGGISAVTALRVGDLLPTNEAENNILLAESNGLNVYPGAVILTEDATRQMLVGIKATYESPDLKDATTGTRYFVNNPNIVNVSADGLITALNNGIANITVIHGASEYILPVIVESPTVVSTSNGTAAQAQLDDEGGIIEIQINDGNNETLTTQLMVAPGTLFDETNIRFTPLLEESQISLTTPSDFRFISGFKLEAGDNPFALPVQLTMELPSQYKDDASVIGQTVYFFELGYVPNATGEIEEKWLVAETGIVGADGMIRTSSPPWKGVRPGEYITTFDRGFGSGQLVKGKIVATFNMPAPFVSLFPISYTQVNNFNTISIGNLDSDIKITNNNTDAYISDGKLTTRVLDSSLVTEFNNISLEISGIGKDIFDLGNEILGLSKEKASLTENIQRLQRIYDALAGGDDEQENQVQKKNILDKITENEFKLNGINGEIDIKSNKKKSSELRRTKLEKRKNTLLDTFNSFTSIPGSDLLGMLETAPFLSISYDISSLEVTQVPAIGLPQVTQTGVQLNAQGLPTFEIKLGIPEIQASGPAAPPVLQQAQLRFQDENNQPYADNEPVLFLKGSNILVENGNDPLGRSFEDLIVKFQMGSTIVEVPVLTDLSERLPDNEFKIAVKIPSGIVLGMSEISVIRRQNKVVSRVGLKEFKEEVKFQSNEINLEATGEYVFGVQRLSDFVGVIDGRDPNALFDTQNILSSADLLLARIPIGTDDVRDRPRDIAVTNDGSRAYATLENTGRIALIDTMVLQQVDINPQTEDVVDLINLGTDASPRSIVIDSRDQYAYVADSRIGVIYVVDVDSNSDKYHQVIEKIQVKPAPYGLREMAISSDGRRLFVTAPSTVSSYTIDLQKSQIIVINIDPFDRPLNESRNDFNWHKQIGTVEAGRRVEGISTTPNPHKIIFTSRQDDKKGFGILEIINDESDNFVADTKYVDLRLGPVDDYFDVNNGIALTITRDGQYGFVVGNNGGPFLQFGTPREDADGVQAGSNIGIILDPLGENPQLVGATRPIPLAFATDLVLSSDDKYLYVANPNGVGVMTYDIDEIIYTLNNPRDFTIDLLDRSEGSKFFDVNTARKAEFIDFYTVPIDDINPLVSVTADYGIIAEDRPRNQFTYGVLEVPDGNGGFVESNRAPIGTYLYNLVATPSDLVSLIGPDGKGNDSTPTFEWDFLVPDEQITEVNLFVSTFAKGEGLLPWDELVDLSDSSFLPQFTEREKRELLTKRWNGYDDFNPDRILTATWKKDTDKWYDRDGTEIIAGYDDPRNTSTRLTLPNNKAAIANANNDLYWAVQATTSTGQTKIETGEFKVAPEHTETPFSSVTVLTHGFTPPIVSAFDVDQYGVPRDYYKIADSITKTFGEETEEKGLTMRYDHATGYWVPVDGNGAVITQLTGGLDVTNENYWSTLITNLFDGVEINGEIVNYFDENNPVNKPLVLIPTWNLRDDNSVVGNESAIPDSGFTEAAADALFASLVMFDQELGGDIGREEDGKTIIYDEQGKLIRTQGGIFDSPLHFIGFSRGTVVNSEIIQRLGTYFPDAGGVERDEEGNIIPDTGDLQMTTLDPHDFDQPSLGVFRDFYEPKVQVWDNVTFADNYYQTVADPNGITVTPNGRNIPGLPESETSKNPQPAGLRFPPGGGTDYTALLNGRTGFTEDNRIGGPHSQVMTWYGGTVDLLLEEMKLYGGITREPDRSQNISTPIYDQLGEEDVQNYASNTNSVTPWYSNEGV